MKLSGRRIQVETTPLRVTGSLNITGGSLVQFYHDGDFIPDREGVPASPIMLTHNVSVLNLDEVVTGVIDITLTTTFYENDVPISNSTNGYEVNGSDLIVKKNTPIGETLEIKAVSLFIDPRNEKVYERIDRVTLRTLIKADAQYQLNLSQSGLVYFDAYRNPNTKVDITAVLRDGTEEITDFSGITFKWLNKDGLNALENELYADKISANGRILTVDKTFINNSSITCEAWMAGKIIAKDTTTFVRKYNSFRFDVSIPELPLQPSVERLTCSLLMYDLSGIIDVDKAFETSWVANEWNVDKTVGYGSKATVSKDELDMEDKNLSIYPDIKRKEAFGALSIGNVVYTDKEGKVLTALKLGK